MARRGVGCQVKACKDERGELKRRVMLLEKQLRDQGNIINTGEAALGVKRATDSRRCEELRVAEWDAQVEREACARRARDRARADMLATELVKQSQVIADLTSELLAAANLSKERAQEACCFEQAGRRMEKKLRRELRKEREDMFREDIQAEARHVERCAVLEVRVSDAECEAEEARARAREARVEAMDEADIEFRAEVAAIEWSKTLLERRLARATAAKERSREGNVPLPSDRSPEVWAQLKGDAARKAAERERRAFGAFVDSHEWRTQDIASVLQSRGNMTQLFDSREGQSIYFERIDAVMRRLEHIDFGIEFALFLHIDMSLTLPKIHRIMQAACKKFITGTNRYVAKAVHYHPYKSSVFVKVPRIVPPVYKVEAVLKEIYSKLNIGIGDDGRVAFRSVHVIMQELLSSKTTL